MIGSMEMNEQKLIKIINEGWSWFGFLTDEIKMVNDFGNLIVITKNGDYLRICPEELSCKFIAKTEKEYTNVINSDFFHEDWRMENLVRIVEGKFGKLGKNEKFCLKTPAVIGGKYSKPNIGKITFRELILFSGELAFQIKDLEDGQKIKLEIKK